MTDVHPVPPPLPALLRATAATPNAQTVHAEVRTDASIPFDPAAAPAYLHVSFQYGAFVLWRVDVSWAEAQKIQLWLAGPAGPGSLAAAGASREEALQLLVANLQKPGAGAFADYIGTYLATGVSHASYTMVVGIKDPIPRDDYQTAWLGAIAALPPPGPPPALSWRADIVEFLKLMLSQPTSQEEFIQLASNVGDLTQLLAAPPAPPGTPRYPMINLLLS